MESIQHMVGTQGAAIMIREWDAVKTLYSVDICWAPTMCQLLANLLFQINLTISLWRKYVTEEEVDKLQDVLLLLISPKNKGQSLSWNLSLTSGSVFESLHCSAFPICAAVGHLRTGG